jgi:hypothetical protein
MLINRYALPVFFIICHKNQTYFDILRKPLRKLPTKKEGMNPVLIEATPTSPAINFCTDGRLLIEGRSLPRNVHEFYKPLVEWINNLSVESVILDVNMEYFNSASEKMLLAMLMSLDANSRIKSLIINWHYEAGDDSVLETGQIFEELLKRVPFRYHEYSETV